jgi:ABC-type multidrug transport system ATPase subunit
VTGENRQSLHVEWFSKKFGGVVALDGASFRAKPGELLGVIGPNGAGKSTLFECVAGVLAADAGTVRVGDAAVKPGARKSALFYLPDAISPWPDQRVGWVLEFIERVFDARKGDRARGRDEIISSLGITPLVDKRIGELSKGQRKRVAVAIGLITPQPFLLLDEPFDGLDLRQSREVELVLREHASRGRGLVLSIHQLADAARLCDRLALLSSGKSVGEGTLDELRAKAGVAGDIEEVFLALT